VPPSVHEHRVSILSEPEPSPNPCFSPCFSLLQVPEEAVLVSLVQWVAASPEVRDPLLPGLAAACVRLSELSLRQLEVLDQHPLVRHGCGMTCWQLRLSRLLSAWGAMHGMSRRI
jgi:hypothetical protein